MLMLSEVMIMIMMMLILMVLIMMMMVMMMMMMMTMMIICAILHVQVPVIHAVQVVLGGAAGGTLNFSLFRCASIS